MIWPRPGGRLNALIIDWFQKTFRRAVNRAKAYTLFRTIGPSWISSTKLSYNGLNPHTDFSYQTGTKLQVDSLFVGRERCTTRPNNGYEGVPCSKLSPPSECGVSYQLAPPSRTQKGNWLNSLRVSEQAYHLRVQMKTLLFLLVFSISWSDHD